MKKLILLLSSAVIFAQNTNRLNIVPNTTTQGRIQFKGPGTGAPAAPSGSDVNVFQRGGKLLCKDASGNDCWAVTNAAGSDVALANISGALVSVKDYGAVGDGTTDDTTAIANAIAASPSVYFPCGSYKITSKLTLTTNKTLQGCSPANHWRGNSGTKILYYGTDKAIEIKSATNGSVDTVNLINFELNGLNATGSANGLVIDGDASNSYVEGIYTNGVTITDFPNYQIYGTGLIFMLSFHNSTFMNPNRTSTGNHTVYFGPGQARSQVFFYDCNIGQYTPAKWAVYETLSASTYFYGGTVFMAGLNGSTGSNGIWVHGGLSIFGTNVEGITVPLAVPSASETCVRYTGSNGSTISGGIINGCAIGVEIGNPASKTTEALYTTISGTVGNNTVDVFIVDGGSRRGTTLFSLGDGTPPITITNNREALDGVTSDVLNWNFTGTNLSIGAMPLASTGAITTTETITGGNLASTGNITGSSVTSGSTLESTSGIVRGNGSNPILINNHVQAQDKVNLSLRAYSSQTYPYLSLQDSTGAERARWNVDSSLYLSGIPYASFPSPPTNGQFVYCTDCQQANPCVAGGSGAFARREAGAWNCAGSGGGGGGGGTLTAVSGSTGVICTTVGSAVTCTVDTAVVPTFLTGSASIDFGSIAQSACATSTITVTGALTGDTVAPGWPAALEAGLIGTMSVTAANTVTVNLCKLTSGTVDPASQTFSATVVKHF